MDFDQGVDLFLACLGSQPQNRPRDPGLLRNMDFSYEDERRREIEEDNTAVRRFTRGLLGKRERRHTALCDKPQTIETKKVYKHINEHPYKLIDVPDIMSLRSAYELNSTTAGPLKTPFGPEVGQGFYSINWMIRSYAQKVPFRFADWKDMVDVAKWLGEYVKILDQDLKDAQSDVETTKDKEVIERYSEAQAYFHMAVTFYDKIKVNAERMAAYYKVESHAERMAKIEQEKRLERIGLKPKSVDKPTRLPYVRDWFEKMNRT